MGLSSLRGLTGALVAWLPPALADPAARAWLDSTAARLPWLTHVAFECHLGSHGERLDLCASVPRQTEVVEALRTLLPASLVAAWLDPDSALGALADTLLLEWDQGAFEPAVFLGLRSAGFDEPAQGALRALLGGGDEAVADLLRGCARALGPGAVALTHVGTMRSRPARPWRLNFALAEPDSATRLLASLPLPEGLRTGAVGLLDELLPLVHHAVLALDVADTLLARVGFECYLTSRPTDGPHWARLLAWLEAHRLCDATEAAALLAWPGEADMVLPEALPEHVARMDALAGEACRSVAWRGLNHVKLVLDEHGARRAKAYLSAGHGWR